jgi:hypothetical protein
VRSDLSATSCVRHADDVVDEEGGAVVEVVPIGGGDAGWDQDPEGLAIGPAERLAEPVEDPTDPSEYPLVLVTWRDAWFDFDEPDPEDARADYLVSTVGYLVRRNTRFVSVAQEILPDGDGFRAVTHIPVAVVETIARLHGTGAVNDIDLLAL